MSERSSELTARAGIPIFQTMSQHDNPTTIHSMRTIASFALLGAVLMGVLTGWMDHNGFDLRIVGAVIGAAVALAAKAFRVL